MKYSKIFIALLITSSLQATAFAKLDTQSASVQMHGMQEMKAGKVSLNLNKALNLALHNNPNIDLAKEQVARAELAQDEAKWQLAPDIRVGANLYKHTGNAQQVDGPLTNADKSARFIGFGGPGSQSGISAEFDFASLLYQGDIANFQHSSSLKQVQAVNHQVLLQVTLAYLTLIEAYKEHELDVEIYQRAKQLASATQNFAQSGQGLSADAELAQVYALNFAAQIELGKANINQANARLVNYLYLPAGTEIIPKEQTMPKLALFDKDITLANLISQAKKGRPDYQAFDDDISGAKTAIKDAELRPYIPKLSLDYSVGDFAGGTDGHLNNSDLTNELRVGIYWEFEMFGSKNKRDIAHKRIDLNELNFRKKHQLSTIEANINALYGQMNALRKVLALQEQSLKHAKSAYQQNIERIFNNAGVPLEALTAMQAYKDNQKNYSRTVKQYHMIEFRLLKEIGQSPLNRLAK